MEQSKNISEEFLLSGLSSGSEEAFDYIFRKYYRLMCSQGISFLKDDDLTQSIVQDCFIRFWEKRNEIKDVKSIYSYLSFMVRNRAIDHLRKREAEQNAMKKLQELSNKSDDPEFYDLDELESKIMNVVMKLPERCRVAFQYSRYDGLKYSDIAKKMNISVKAVEALISRALKILRLELAEYLSVIFFLHLF